MANSALAVCRVCLADNIRMHSIRNTLYQEMFEKLSGTKLITEDGRPDTVCYICNSQLRRFRTIYLMSQNSELKLTKLLRGGKKLTKRKMSMLERETHNLSITPMKNTSTEGIPMIPEDKTTRMFETETETQIKSISTNLVVEQPKEKHARSVLEHLMYEHSYSMLALEVDKLNEMEVDSMDDQTYNYGTNDTLSEDLLSDRDMDTNAEESLSDLLNDEEFRLHFVDEPSEVALTKPEVALTVTKPEVPATTTKPEVSLTVTNPKEAVTVANPEVAQTVSQYELPPTVTKPEVTLIVTKPEAAVSVMRPKVAVTVTKPKVAVTVTKPPARKKKSEMLAIDLALKAEMEKLCGIEIDHDVGEHNDDVTALPKTDKHQKTYEDAIPSTQTGVQPSEIEAPEIEANATGKTHSRNLRSSDSKTDESDEKNDLNKLPDTEKANVTPNDNKPSNAKMDKTSKLRRAYLRHTSIDMKPASFKPRNTRKTQLRNRSTDSDTAVNQLMDEPDMSVDSITAEMPVDTKTASKQADTTVLEKPGGITDDVASSDIAKGVAARKAPIRKGRNKSDGMPQMQNPESDIHTHNTRRSTPKIKTDATDDKAHAKGNKADATGDKAHAKSDKNVTKVQGTYPTNIRKSMRNVLKKKTKQVGLSKTTVGKLAHLRGKLVKTGKKVLKNKSNARNLGGKSNEIEVDVKVESLDSENCQGVLDVDEDMKKKNRTEDHPMDGSHDNTVEKTECGIRDSILEDWVEDDEPTFEPENITTTDKEEVRVVNETTETEKSSVIIQKRKSKKISTTTKTGRKSKTVKKFKENTDFGCELCPNSFDSKSDLREHQMEVHKSYCYICCKNLSNSGHLKNHMLIHTGEKPYVCKVCGKRTNNKSNLTKHLNVHKQNKSFCVICNRVIGISLAEHMIKIHEPKINTQNSDLEKYNDKEMEDSSNIDLDKPTNDEEMGDSPYMDMEKTANDTEKAVLSNTDLENPIDDIETAGFSNTDLKKAVPRKRKSKLKKPMKARKGKSMKKNQKGLKIITGKVSCTKCEMRFSSLSSLAEHYKAHNRKAPFSCDICFEKFNHLILLKRHVVVHIM